MKIYKTFAVAIGCLLILSVNSCEETIEEENTVTDYDDNIYQTVRIGNQIWMAENLRVTHYSDGTRLSVGTNVGDISGDITTKYYFWNKDDSVRYAKTHGALYTWAAAMNGAESSSSNPSGVQGACPSGWHLPSDAEWKELEMYLGMSQKEADTINARGTDEGGKLKEAGYIHWITPNTEATNSSGFTALPSGFRYAKGGFISPGRMAFYWTSTDNENNVPWWRGLSHSGSGVFRLGSLNSKTAGQSVRCVKD